MRVTRTIDATTDRIEEAKQTAVTLIGNGTGKDAIDLFYMDDLAQIENGIKSLNEFSKKSWLLSSILLFTLIYNRNLYEQSGLDWFHYSKQSRERLGLDNREITEQLSTARFFIQHHKALERAGFSVSGSNRKLSRAELALSLCGDIDLTVRHVAEDSWLEFSEWYTGLKKKKKGIARDGGNRRDDFSADGGRFTIGGKEAVTVADDIGEADRERLKGYIREIFAAIRDGYEPAIVPTYDKKEAAIMVRLRDKHRRGK